MILALTTPANRLRLQQNQKNGERRMERSAEIQLELPLKQKSMSFCIFRDVASAGLPKEQENVDLEHRFRTSPPLHAKCKTYAPDCRLRGLLEAPRRRRRGKCKTAHFHALKRNSKWNSAVHPLRTNTEFSISVSAQRRIYIRMYNIL